MAKPLAELTLIAIDTETTGQYPLDAELCEIAAVKSVGGKVIDRYQKLVRPRKPMSQQVINIHGITNEMVRNEAPIEDVIADFHSFIKDGHVVAHHAPFDMAFLTIAFENNGLELPLPEGLCTSLISRKTIVGSQNHKLQTLIPYLGLTKGTAHRALDDAEACLELMFKCIEKAEAETLEDLVKIQGVKMDWNCFSMEALKKHEYLSVLREAIIEKRRVQLVYEGGSKPGRERTLEPISIVRSPTGDFLVARDGQPQPKRFYLSKVGKVRF